MDRKTKTVLVAAVGAAIGVTVFGGALASHALVRAMASGAPAQESQAVGCAQGGECGAVRPFGGCQSAVDCTGGSCAQGQCPKMGARGGCPQGDAGACPQGDTDGCPQSDVGACPQDAPAPCTEGGTCSGAAGVTTSES